jgi:hypothetical protein
VEVDDLLAMAGHIEIWNYPSSCDVLCRFSMVEVAQVRMGLVTLGSLPASRFTRS